MACSCNLRCPTFKVILASCLCLPILSTGLRTSQSEYLRPIYASLTKLSMDAAFPILPVPGVGTFDEESCRYFLQEIGEQIVPFFPFVFGISEVYTLLLERYGKYWVADALSVLHELMEAEDNANGLGDDGDIFRSWRHSWRHRNVGFCTLRSGQSITLSNRMIRRIPSYL